METIKPGKYVEIIYDLYEVDPTSQIQTLRHQSDPQDPEKFVFGVTRGMIKPLEEALEGKKKGDKYDIVVDSADAFGPYDPEQVATLEKDIFEVDGKFDDSVIKPGAIVPMLTQDGYRISGIVKEVSDKEVVMDFNHPLAGKDVRFKGEVLTVRDATPEELQPVHSCGCGCDHDHCGDGCGDHCGDDCSDGCGCSDNHGCGCC